MKLNDAAKSKLATVFTERLGEFLPEYIGYYIAQTDRGLKLTQVSKLRRPAICCRIGECRPIPLGSPPPAPRTPLNGYQFQHVEAYFLEPDITNPDDLYKLLTVANNAGGVTPNFAKRIIYEAFGEQAEDYPEEWGDTPHCPRCPARI